MKCRYGYSLIEVVIAGAILAMAIMAAASLASSLVQQQEWVPRGKAMLNIQEQAAKLFHLGLSPSQITNILPIPVSPTNSPPEGQVYLQFLIASTNVPGAGTMERALCRLTFASQRRMGGALSYRTNQVLIVRPSIR